MPKKAKELSALAVRRLQDEGRYAVGGADGLHLRITGGSKAWVLRVMVGATRREMGLGPYPEVSLAEARQTALARRKQIREGIDPVEQRKADRGHAVRLAAKAKTFEECSKAVIEAKAPGFKNRKTTPHWESTFEKYVFPKLGNRPVSSITNEEVAEVLQPIWRSKYPTAKKVRIYISAVFDYAKAMKYREGENPAAWKGTLEPILGKTRHRVKHYPSLPYVETGAFIAELRKREGMAARALELAILCAVRSNEVRGAVRSEFDIEAKIWTVPAERMKADKDLRVPLSPAAVTLLNHLPAIVGTELLFPSRNNRPLSDMALSSLVKDLHHAHKKSGGNGFIDPTCGKVAVPHGFRSSFKDYCRSETRYADEISELALAHVNSDATRTAYARADLFPLRAKLMNDWAKHCATPKPKSSANVVDLYNHKRRAH